MEQNTFLEVEMSLRKLDEKHALIESEVNKVLVEIQNVHKKLESENQELSILEQRKNKLCERKKKHEVELENIYEKIEKLQKTLLKLKDKISPGTHLNMPYNEKSIENIANDESEDETEVNKHIEDYENIISHPITKHDENFSKEVKNKFRFVIDPNVHHSKSYQKSETEKLTRQEREKFKCKCIDEDILQKCSSLDDCKFCSKAVTKQIKKYVSKISFAPEADFYDDSKHIGVNCDSFSDCKNCADMINLASEGKMLEAKKSEVSLSEKSIDIGGSCMSFHSCRDCRIAKEMKKIEATREFTEKTIHRHCHDSFCIPRFAMQTSVKCKKHQSDNRPFTAPSKISRKNRTSQNIKKEIHVPAYQHQIYQATSTDPKVCKSFTFCQNCSSLAPIINVPSELVDHCESKVKNCKSLDECRNCYGLALTAALKTNKKEINPTYSQQESDNGGGVDWQKYSSFAKSLRPSSRKSPKNESLRQSDDVSKSYEQMKQFIEDQNRIVVKLQSEIQLSALKNDPEVKFQRLTDKLEAAKAKLRKLIQQAMLEQKKQKNENWKPINVIEDL